MVFKIKHSAEVYRHLADKAYENGDYAAYVSALHRSLEQKPTTTKAKELAHFFIECSQIERAMWYLALAKLIDDTDHDVYPMASVMYLENSEPDKGAHYARLAFGNGDLPNGKRIVADFDPSELEPNKERIHRIEKHNRQQALLCANTMLGMGDVEQAEQIAASVPDDSPQYAEAVALRSIIALGKGDDGELEEHIQTLSELGENDLQSTILKALMLNAGGKTDEAASELKRVDEMNVSDLQSIDRIANCAVRLGDDKLAVKYLSRILDEFPEDRDVLASMALAKYNLGDHKSAKYLIGTAQMYYPDDYELKFFGRLIQMQPDYALDLSCNVSDDKAEEWYKELIDFFDQNRSLSQVVDRLLNDKSMLELLNWAARDSESMEICNILEFISRSEKMDDFVKMQLIDDRISMTAKRVMATNYMIRNAGGKLYIMRQGLLDKMFIALPQVSGALGCHKNAYIKAYVLLFTLGMDAFDIMTAIYIKSVSEWSKEPKTSYDMTDDVWAASLTAATLGEQYYDLSAKIFDAKPETVRKYIADYKMGGERDNL